MLSRQEELAPSINLPAILVFITLGALSALAVTLLFAGESASSLALVIQALCMASGGFAAAVLWSLIRIGSRPPLL